MLTTVHYKVDGPVRNELQSDSVLNEARKGT